MSVEYIVSTEYDGKTRRLYPRSCLFCQKEFYSPRHAGQKYCSRTCFHQEYRKNSRFETNCAQCGKRVIKSLSKRKNSVHQIFFCSRNCKDLAQSFDGSCPEIRPLHYIDGRRTYRERAIRVYGAHCNHCGYNEVDFMLDVHHKDFNRAHNAITNLEVLCVWCHALVTRTRWASSSFSRALHLQCRGGQSIAGGVHHFYSRIV